MRVFVDTNVLLDVLARRDEFYDPSARIWTLAERGEIEAFISAISFNHVYYIIRKARDKTTADTAMKLLRDVFDSVAPDTRIVNQAIDSEFGDFEDALQFHSAVRCHADHIITRNPGDFPTTKPAVLTPEEFLAFWIEDINS
jgi:predicted nucleic acid-binding protein